MATVHMTSDLKASNRDGSLPAATIATWAAHLPPQAQVSHLTVEAGDQRETYTIFGGLHAQWTEDRPDLPGATVSGSAVWRP